MIFSTYKPQSNKWHDTNFTLSMHNTLGRGRQVYLHVRV